MQVATRSQQAKAKGKAAVHQLLSDMNDLSSLTVSFEELVKKRVNSSPDAMISAWW